MTLSSIELLANTLNERYSSLIQQSCIAMDELTVDLLPQHLLELCFILRDDETFVFDQLMDVCGVDLLHYGVDEWQTFSATASGFERGVEVNSFETAISHQTTLPHRFATVYHLLSLSKNHRVRLKVKLDTQRPVVPSVVPVWPSANWFEREAFDLYGIHFENHPDLRRILTDYGFIGHPFRKDFPLIGNVEVRYDATRHQVIYEPVSIEPRILEPKVIREDNRYEVGDKNG